MSECIMVGCDLHDKSMLLKIAVGRNRAEVRSWGTGGTARDRMMADLHRRAKRAGVSRIVFAYEACGFGFRLYDELTSAGIECHVLAPSKMPQTPKRRKRKTDERDAEAILDLVRAHVLAGIAMPSVWIPDRQTRDDRELVRRRLAVAEDCSTARVRIRWLLKGRGLESASSRGWTVEYWSWLEDLAAGGLAGGAGASLRSLMRQVQWLSEERTRLEVEVRALSESGRYAPVVTTLCRVPGVGLLTAMVFLTELGDLSRFANRRQVGSFLGLTPSSHESGEQADRKGHITHQGPARVRKVLCQAVWSRLRVVASEQRSYERIVQRNLKHKKIAVVARMRVLGIRLWHDGLAAQEAMRAADREAAGREVMMA